MYDLEKVNILRSYFSTDNMNLLIDKEFARFAVSKNSNINEDSFYKLLNRWKGKSLQSKIKSPSKETISDIFNLDYSIWTTTYSSKNEFIADIKDMIKRYNVFNRYNEELIWNKPELSKDEEDIIKKLKKEKTISIPGNIDKYSPNFKFELSKLLKNNNQIQDAYTILKKIENDFNSNFKYKYKNEIDHFKAILLSVDEYKKWDKAIDILKYLFANGYYEKEPEVITLLASNYKRKAIYTDYGLREKEYINMDMLVHSYSLYKMAYSAKAPKEKYYDAINLAYLILIIDNIDDSDIDIERYDINSKINKLYTDSFKSLSVTNWWETITKVEFLFLLKQYDEALLILDNYENEITVGDLQATIRQLNILKRYIPEYSKPVDDFINELNLRQFKQ